MILVAANFMKPQNEKENMSDGIIYYMLIKTLGKHYLEHWDVIIDCFSNFLSLAWVVNKNLKIYCILYKNTEIDCFHRFILL